MSSGNLSEKLQMNGAKNILIQGLPSSVEKHFSKINFSKNVTPLLKIKKTDFALLFALSSSQLCNIIKDVLPALGPNSKLWIAYPKPASKIASDLSKDCSWKLMKDNGFTATDDFEMDTVWSVMRFDKEITENELLLQDTKKPETVSQPTPAKFDKKLSIVPVELSTLFKKQLKAKEFFFSLSPNCQKQYVTWITGAKKEDVRQRRLEETLQKLLAGKKSPTEK